MFVISSLWSYQRYDDDDDDDDDDDVDDDDDDHDDDRDGDDGDDDTDDDDNDTTVEWNDIVSTEIRMIPMFVLLLVLRYPKCGSDSGLASRDRWLIMSW